METSVKPLGIGVIGLGGFGHYALQQFAQVPGVHVVGMAATANEQAASAMRRFGAPDFGEIDKLLAAPGLDLVYIATPPFLHYEQAMAALRAGKHVICEKPLAINVAQAEEMLAEADKRGLQLITNLMQPYNTLFPMVDKVVHEQILGKPLHGFFENYASDENLGPNHWFWDPEKSGGIFVEHGVHFFAAFARWLGEGRVVAAQSLKRPGSGIEEAVNCTVLYQNDVVPVNYYHGFTQPSRMDRQEWRLLFEQGDITLHEWVPTRLVLNALVDEEQTRRLMEIFEGGRLRANMAGHQIMRARHQEKPYYQQIRLEYDLPGNKADVYSDLLFRMLTDQKAFIDDPSRDNRTVKPEDGLKSLKLAEAARNMAG